MIEKINLNKNKESAFVNELNKIIDSPRDFRPAHIEVILQQVSDKELLGVLKTASNEKVTPLFERIDYTTRLNLAKRSDEIRQLLKEKGFTVNLSSDHN